MRARVAASDAATAAIGLLRVHLTVLSSRLLGPDFIRFTARRAKAHILRAEPATYNRGHVEHS